MEEKHDPTWVDCEVWKRIQKLLPNYKPGDCIDLGSATGKMFMEELQK